MLQIENIRKEYKTGPLIQKALDGVSLNFRDSEFAAILGPSGSGKTTLLNIIGGLDRYDSGDLIINGTSTKKYKDRDWDSYRNHTIGFIFQSYNLIPHQTVLENVELALTVSGISRSERKKRASEALAAVGLGEQIHKKPSQMSGGQMQRVAIARALVNNPDILVADEPTGALDSATSIQVMNLLQEVAKDRLVIMVTHNPELAHEYATRIVELRDGHIISDSNPFILGGQAADAAGVLLAAGAVAAGVGAAGAAGVEEAAAGVGVASAAGVAGASEAGTAAGATAGAVATEAGATAIGAATAAEAATSATGVTNAETLEETTNVPRSTKNPHGKTSMSFLTALYLSLKNLLTKKARTLLVAFAGSIGIIGIALILSMSNGVNAYINSIEEDTMSEYPISIQASGVSLTGLMEYMAESGQSEAEVTEIKTVSSMLNTVNTNDLASLKVYLESGESDIAEYVKTIRYIYNITPQIYRENDDDTITQVNPYSALSAVSETLSLYSSFSSSFNMVQVFSEMPENEDLYITQYDVKAGRWPENRNEAVVVLMSNGMINDLTLYITGLKSDSTLQQAMDDYVAGETGNEYGDEKVETFNYEDFLGIKFKVIPSSSLYVYDSEYDIWTSKGANAEFVKSLVADGEELEIVGVVMPAEDATATMLSAGINYRYDLTANLIEVASESDVVKAQLESTKINVLTGEEFGSDDEKSLDLGSMFSIDESAFADAFSMGSTSFDTSNMNFGNIDMSSLSDMNIDSTDLTKIMAGALSGVDLSDVNLGDYIDMDELAENMPQLTTQDIQKLMNAINLDISSEALQQALTELLNGYSDYVANNPNADIEKLGSSISSYMRSDTARAIITSDLQSIMSKVQAGMISQSDIQQIVENVMAGYADWAEENGITDLSNYAENLAAYLGSAQAQAILNSSMDDILQKLAAIELTEEDFAKIADDVSAGYETYASENGMPTTEDVVNGLGEYLSSDSATEIMLNTLKNSIDSEAAEKAISEIVQEKLEGEEAEALKNMLISALSNMLGDTLGDAMSNMGDQYSQAISQAMTSAMSQIASQLQNSISSSVTSMISQMAGGMSIDPTAFTNAITMNMDEEDMKDLLTALMTRDTSTYDTNLKNLGYADLKKPDEIMIYPLNFESKDYIIKILDDYNARMEAEGEEDKIITYTDMVGTLMSSVTTIINVISYVLIAFVSISLIVSSIMIGVITYISVFERRKEIGILRSIGASKRNISSVFNAETFITGLLAGLLGTGLTLLILIPGNIILRTLTGQPNLAAFLQPQAVIILIALSVILTLIGGLLPAKKAANSDPVKALRDE